MSILRALKLLCKYVWQNTHSNHLVKCKMKSTLVAHIDNNNGPCTLKSSLALSVLYKFLMHNNNVMFVCMNDKHVQHQ